MDRKLSKHLQAIAGLIIIFGIVLTALFAPAIAPHDPTEIDLARKFLPPSEDYPLGTDQLGRCELSRLIFGARHSLAISLPILSILAIIGLTIGTFGASIGGKTDRILTMVCDIFVSFPSLIIAVAVIGILGNGLENLSLAVVVAMWAWFTRTVHAYTMVEMGKDYVLAARICGCGPAKLIIRHLIPNILPQFFVYLSTGVASSILMVSSFAFLGLGLPHGVSEWGAMLNEARSSLYSHPSLLIYPGSCILVTAAGFNLFGEALRDTLLPEEETI